MHLAPMTPQYDLFPALVQRSSMWVNKAQGMSQSLKLELSLFFLQGYFLGVLYMPQFHFGKLSLVISLVTSRNL